MKVAIYARVFYSPTILLKIRLGEKIFRVRHGRPHCHGGWKFEKGPFGCWLLSWRRLQLGWELARWTE